jgi:hypothetical protein
VSDSTAVDETQPGGAVAVSAEQEAALAARVKGQVDRSKLQLPAIKVVNGLSKEASEGVAQGTLVNSLTGEQYGEAVEVVISDFYYGRFYAPKGGGKAYTARGEVVPDNWPEEYAGQRFTELDDAEEQWKLAVNNNEHPWGSGPPIQTTINFVVTLAENPGFPLRLSMKSSDTPTANKILQMIDMAPTPWAYAYTVSSEGRPTPNGSGTYYGFKAEQGGTASDEQRQAAVKIALAFQNAIDSGDGIEEAGEDDADAKGQAKAAKRAKAAAKAKEGEGLGV